MTDRQSKVLIISSSFTMGDAVTAMSLFSKWDKDNLYCISTSFQNNTNYFNSCYKLGNSEISYAFPFKHFLKLPPTILNYDDSLKKDEIRNVSFLRNLYNILIIPILKYLGIYSSRIKIDVSEQLFEWINHISPNIIYTSVSNLETAKFILKIMEVFPKIKYVIHGYDEWCNPNYSIMYRNCFRKHAENILRQILNRASGFYVISEKMAVDYEKKYGIKFKVLSNPAIIKDIYPHEIKNNVLFMGKIGKHNIDSIKLMAKALFLYNKNNPNSILKFEIYSDIDDEHKESLLAINPNCIFNNWVSHEKIPTLLAESKILFLPISFSKETEKFTKYSMSTKMGEYLSSKRPIVYCGPKNIAMTDFLLKHNCSFVITNNNPVPFIEVIELIMNDNSCVNNIIENAKQICKNYFDIEKISSDFYFTLNNLR